MVQIRRWIYKTRKGEAPEFHLLISAYQPIYIGEKLTFQEELYPLTVEGYVHIGGHVPISQHCVWLNVTNEHSDLFKLRRVGNSPPTKNIWNLWGWFWKESVEVLGGDDSDEYEPPGFRRGRSRSRDNCWVRRSLDSGRGQSSTSRSRQRSTSYARRSRNPSQASRRSSY